MTIIVFSVQFMILYLFIYLMILLLSHAVIIIGDYSYKSAFVADQEINILACMIDLMSEAVKFK